MSFTTSSQASLRTYSHQGDLAGSLKAASEKHLGSWRGFPGVTLENADAKTLHQKVAFIQRTLNSAFVSGEVTRAALGVNVFYGICDLAREI